MSIGIQGEAGGEVAGDIGHGFDVHTVLEGYRCECVAKVMEAQLLVAS